MKNKKTRFTQATSLLLSMVLVMALLLSSCGSSNSSTEENTQNPSSSPSSEAASSDTIDYQYLTVNEDGTRSFQDMKGNDVTVPAEVDTILTVAWPGNSPTIQLLRLGDLCPAYMDSMKGEDYFWTQQCNPGILEKPSLGDTAEELMTYDPDIVFTKTTEKQNELAQAGLNAACMSPVTLEDVLKSIRLTAEISGRADAVRRAEEYTAYYNETVDMINERLSDVTEDEMPTVYIVNGQHGTTPLLTNGSGTLTETFSELCRFKLATVDIVEGDAVEITAEQLLSLNPDYICIMGMNAYDAYDALMADPTLKDLDAVKNDLVTFVPKGNQPMNGTGVENVLYMQWQVKLLYPEKFEDLDMHQIVSDFYNNFMGYDIPDEYVDDMLAGKSSPDKIVNENGTSSDTTAS